MMMQIKVKIHDKKIKELRNKLITKRKNMKTMKDIIR